MKNLAIALMFAAWVLGTLLIIATFIGVIVLLIADEWFEIPGKLINKLTDKPKSAKTFAEDYIDRNGAWQPIYDNTGNPPTGK